MPREILMAPSKFSRNLSPKNATFLYRRAGYTFTLEKYMHLKEIMKAKSDRINEPSTIYISLSGGPCNVFKRQMTRWQPWTPSRFIQVQQRRSRLSLVLPN